MKIGVDARPLTVPTFGIGRYASELLKRLPLLDKNHEWFLYADRPLRGEWPENVVVRDCSNHFRPLSLGRTQLTYCHWATMDSLDVFWSPRHHLPLLMSIPQVVSIHDMVWKKYPQTMQRANWWVERLLQPASAKKAKAIITISHASKRDIHEVVGVNPDKITVIYPSADMPFAGQSSTEISNQGYFFFLGTNDPRKNLQGLLNAHQQYRRNGGDKDLVIAGSVGWGGSLKLHDGVVPLGYVEDSRLHGLISNSVALLLPSFYEGFGLPLVEAIKLGVPVIASNVSAMPEVVGEAGLLINPDKGDELVAALTAMSNESTRQELAKNCREQAQKFDWDNAAKSTLVVIESVV